MKKAIIKTLDNGIRDIQIQILNTPKKIVFTSHIYSAIRQGFWLQITKSVLCDQFCYNTSFRPFLNNPKDLDPSYEMDLEFQDYFGRKKPVL